MSTEAEKLLALEKEYSAARTTLLTSALTAAQQKTLGEVDKKLDDLRKRKEAEASQGGGGGAILSLASAKNDEDTAAAFAKLLPREKTQLWMDDRDEWQRGLDAVDREGTRRLMGSY